MDPRYDERRLGTAVLVVVCGFWVAVAVLIAVAEIVDGHLGAALLAACGSLAALTGLHLVRRGR